MERFSGQSWFIRALLIVTVVTSARLVLLAYNRTDLFVDEAQYWLWGQNPAFGYFSKPPMIAWLIGAVTGLAQSDDAFWVRMPGAPLHGLTALILATLAARIGGPKAAVWTAATYVTLPMTAIGSLLISTDTVMAPFYAAALLFHHRLLQHHRMRDALLVGAMVGLACLSKYAGIYLPIGMALAGLLRNDLRPTRTEVAVIAVVVLAIVTPNFLWNLGNRFSTFAETEQNIGWIREANPLSWLDFRDVFDFWATQLAVVGPIVFVAILTGFFLYRRQPFLVALSLPALAVVSVQSILYRAYANWAVGSYFAGSILAVLLLAGHPRLRMVSLVTNTLICLAFPLLTLFPEITRDGRPLLHRYLGRADVSRQILALSASQGAVAVVSSNREIIADLFYTGAGTGQSFYTPLPENSPTNHYEQFYAMPLDLSGPVLLVAPRAPGCPHVHSALDLAGTAYEKTTFAAYLVDADCVRRFPADLPEAPAAAP